VVGAYVGCAVVGIFMSPGLKLKIVCSVSWWLIRSVVSECIGIHSLVTPCRSNNLYILYRVMHHMFFLENILSITVLSFIRMALEKNNEQDINLLPIII
jgi:hypothetical protein